MGTIDPVPQTGKIQRPPRPVVAVPAETKRPFSRAGKAGLIVGALFFFGGAAAGGNLIACGIGILLIAAGFVSRQSEPQKTCPACRNKIAAAASICGHCRVEQPA